MTATASAQTDARDLFTELTGAVPAGSWSAPGRVNLIGEHTDYNDGFVFPFAIDARTVAAVGVRDDRRIRVISTFDPVPVEVALADLDGLFPAHRDEIVEWARYPLGVAWALQDAVRPAGRHPRRRCGLDIAPASAAPCGR